MTVRAGEAVPAVRTTRAGTQVVVHFTQVARSAGFDFSFAHGLCTVTMCTHRVLDVIGVVDPGHVAPGRGAVRVADPAGGELTVRSYGAGAGVLAFDAACGEATVVTDGRSELHP